MILVIGGVKGGSGKTTIATNLAVIRSKDQYKVLLVDADEQKSCSDWSEQRESFGHDTEFTTIQLAGKSLHTQIQKLIGDYDDIIIDVGGRDTNSQRFALTIADVFLVPFRPKSLDVWTLGKVNELIYEVKMINQKIKCFAVINQADSSGSDNISAREAIQECPNLVCLDITLGYRKAFSTASAMGLSVVEMKPIDQKACYEINHIYEDICDMHKIYA